MGINILWNFLTYSAWMIRFWDYFPDKIAQYHVSLAGWGVILPALLCLAALRFPKTRRAIARALILFILLLAPVLPLVRHSYFYYLYLPLVPMWLLAGGLLGDIQRRLAPAGILVLFFLNSLLFGIRHRSAEMFEGVLAEPILRYAAVAKHAVNEFRESGGVKKGDLLFLSPSVREDIDSKTEHKVEQGTPRKQFSFLELALLDGQALRLFFPDIQATYFEGDSDHIRGWESMHIYWTYGIAGLQYLGYGWDARFKVVEFSMKTGDYKRAKREANIMLALRPHDPIILLVRGLIALKQNDSAGLESVLEKLERLADEEGGADQAKNSLGTLKQMIERHSHNQK
jgi:hypothetical protein